MKYCQVIVRSLMLASILVTPAIALAQEQAAILGTITDSTGGVLPGVTITAVHQETGNTFESVTDEGGRYRIPVRVGHYEIRAQLQGFQTITRTGLELLLGQQPIVN